MNHDMWLTVSYNLNIFEIARNWMKNSIARPELCFSNIVEYKV